MSETTERISPPQRSKDEVDLAFRQVVKMHMDGSMPTDVYYKCLICLAYEYIQNDDHQIAIILIHKCPPEYFEKVQPDQVKEDKAYADVVTLLAYKLIQMGLVDGDVPLYSPTQAKALA